MTNNNSNLSNGTLSIENKNIFNILKKWLYTENDIVFRELISNAKDAIEKLSTIKDDTKGKIKIILDTEKNDIIIKDNGIGMTYDEVNKYINQIAFSGAKDFINKSQSAQNNIIGHFGVGFYSSFMICDYVSIETKSYLDDEKAVSWNCKSNMEFDMQHSQKEDIGTNIILHLKENDQYINNPKLVFDIIKKYFEFADVDIIFKAPEYDDVQVNNPIPIWKKIGDTSETHKQELNNFYKDFFDDVSDPIFTLNIASPDIGVNGILFFRETKGDTHELDGVIKIYSRGVYIGENIKELIPPFVNLQSGIIECNNLPLVVSRSDIRDEDNNYNVISLISECLAQEVTIALNDMFTKERPIYEKHWDNINAFIKYSVLKDKTFSSVMTRKVIFKDLYGKYMTIDEYLENITSSEQETVYYTSDEIEQAHYIEIFKKFGLNALCFDHVIDQPFMRRYEVIKPNLKFIRIDSNIDSLYGGTISDNDKDNIDTIAKIFENAIGKRLESFILKITNLEQESISTVIINDEKSRRMADMLEIYGYINKNDFSSQKIQSNSVFLINLKNDIINKILKSNNDDLKNDMCNQLFDLSLMSQQKLEAEDVEAFIIRSEKLLKSMK